MNAKWEAATPERPDPYLDWEFRNRSSGQESDDELWCSVFVQLKPGDDGSYSANLQRLRREVRDQRKQDNDEVPNGTITIRMTDEEFRYLERVIRDTDGQRLSAKANPVEMQFFIYRPERLIYRNGQLDDRGSTYTIMLAGPPIQGLVFQQEFGPSIIPRAFVTPPVAIGIIDDGIGFAHERFRIASGGSRISAIWLQDREQSTADNGVAIGRRVNNQQINELIEKWGRDVDIYQAESLLDFRSHGHKSLSQRVSHGTHVLDLAAGYNPSEISDPGANPIFAVQLPADATADTSGATMGSYVLQAFRQIMLWADELDEQMPLVINFSYGILAGPKDGTHPIEKAIDQLAVYRSERAVNPAPTRVVLAAGNNFRSRATAKISFNRESNSEWQDLDWMILPDDRTPSFIEIWLDDHASDDRVAPVELKLTPPIDGPSIVSAPEIGKLDILQNGNSPVAAIYYDLVPVSEDKSRPRIFIAVNQTAAPDGDANIAPSGRWQLSIKNRINEELTAKLHIQRDDTPSGYPQQGRQSYFEHPDAYERDPATGEYTALNSAGPITHDHTLSAIASGNRTIVVGATEASESFPPASYTSSGPTETRSGPDYSAIADDGAAFPGVLAAGTNSGTVVAMRGTSVAAPRITREIADLLASGKSVSDICTGTVATAREPKRQGCCVLIKDNSEHIPKRKYSSNS